MASRRAILGQDFRHQLRPRRRNRQSHGISVWHELVGVLESSGRCYRPNSCDGGSVFIFPRVDLPWALSIRREAPWTACALVLFPDDVSRLLAFRLFDRRDRCMDAITGGLQRGARRIVSATKFMGARFESVGALAIRAHDGRSSSDWMFHDGRGR